ncbi:MAG: Holliday junction resolvase RuvX [Acidobacteria bacterium]|nr:Holliday junction resolvase RuvX [Acidobacteriota bacterium]
MQQKEITNSPEITEAAVDLPGRIIALDPGTKRIGIAICDESRITIRPLPYFARSSWKKLLSHVTRLIGDFDAKMLVIGLPLASDGAEQDMSVEARDMARKFSLSLTIPVILQDERVTSYEAKRRLWERGLSLKEAKEFVDSEAACVILEDLLASSSSAAARK